MKVFNRIVISGIIALLLTIGLCYAQSDKAQHSRQAVDYAAQGKFKEAKEEFEKSLKIDPFFGPAKRALKVIEDLF